MISFTVVGLYQKYACNAFLIVRCARKRKPKKCPEKKAGIFIEKMHQCPFKVMKTDLYVDTIRITGSHVTAELHCKGKIWALEHNASLLSKPSRVTSSSVGTIRSYKTKRRNLFHCSPNTRSKILFKATRTFSTP